MVDDHRLAHEVPDYDDVEVGDAAFADRRGIVFLGNLRHPPNVDAVEYRMSRDGNGLAASRVSATRATGIAARARSR